MDTKSHPRQYPTRDIYLASVIKLSGIPILRVDKNGGRGIFVFQASDMINEIIRKYFNNELQFDPKTLFETWKSLKSLAFSAIDDVRYVS